MSYDEGDIIKVSEDGRFRLRIVLDEDPQNPRENGDFITHIASVPNSGYLPAEKDNGPLGHIMRHLAGEGSYGRYGRNGHTVAENFARAVRMLGGAAYLFDSAGYRDGPVLHVIYLTAEDIARETEANRRAQPDWEADWEAWLKAEADEYTAYARGDVYGWVVEEHVDWTPVPPVLVADAVSMATWEEAESCWGFYGDDYVKTEGMATFNLIVANAAEK